MEKSIPDDDMEITLVEKLMQEDMKWNLSLRSDLRTNELSGDTTELPARQVGGRFRRQEHADLPQCWLDVTVVWKKLVVLGQPRTKVMSVMRILSRFAVCGRQVRRRICMVTFHSSQIR